jgi:hypothetical protein
MPGALGDFAYPFRSGDATGGDNCDCKFFWYPQFRALFQVVGLAYSKPAFYPEFTSASTPPKIYLQLDTKYKYFAYGGGAPDTFVTWWEKTVIDPRTGSGTTTDSSPAFPSPYSSINTSGWTHSQTVTKTTQRDVWVSTAGNPPNARLEIIQTISKEYTTEELINDVLDDIDDFPAAFPGTLHSGGTLTSGHDYAILDNSGGADFTASGASSNEIGTVFNANTTAPTWGSGVVAEYDPSPGVDHYISATGAASGGWFTTGCYQPGNPLYDSTGYIPAAWRWLKTNEKGFTLVRVKYCLALPKLAGAGSFTATWDEQDFPFTSSSDPDIPGQPDWGNPGSAAGQSVSGDETLRTTTPQTIADPASNKYVFIANAQYTALA